jgi:hypothetical protein
MRKKKTNRSLFRTSSSAISSSICSSCRVYCSKSSVTSSTSSAHSPSSLSYTHGKRDCVFEDRLYIYVCPEPVLANDHLNGFCFTRKLEERGLAKEEAPPALRFSRALAPLRGLELAQRLRCPAENASLFSQRFLCLSRACLGKMFVFIYIKTRALTAAARSPPAPRGGTSRGAAINSADPARAGCNPPPGRL